MNIEAAHADEGGPVCGMNERRVRITDECDLRRTKRLNGITSSQQGSVKRDHESTTDRVVDVPQARHDVRHARGQERPPETQGPLNARYRARRRSARGEHHQASAWERASVQLAKVERPAVSTLGIAGQEESGR